MARTYIQLSLDWHTCVESSKLEDTMITSMPSVCQVLHGKLGEAVFYCISSSNWPNWAPGVGEIPRTKAARQQGLCCGVSRTSALPPLLSRGWRPYASILLHPLAASGTQLYQERSWGEWSCCLGLVGGWILLHKLPLLFKHSTCSNLMVILISSYTRVLSCTLKS